MTKSGTGTWDLGRTWDLRMQRLGDAETRGCRDLRMQGLGDSGTGRLGEAGRRGGGDAGRRESGVGGDAVNKREFFGVLDLYDGGFVCRLVADDFQPSWFGLICLLASLIDKEYRTTLCYLQSVH